MRLTIEKIISLKKTDLFSQMRNNALLDMYSLGVEICYNKYDEIVTEGSIVDGLYVVLQGSVNVIKKDKIVSEIKAHEYFGLLFAFDASQTNYTFKANEDCVIFKINGDGLYDVLPENKDFAHNLIMTMCQRIKEKNKWIYS